MPRIRALKPEFFRSPDVAQLDFPVRIFYQALWCWADDFGIGETNIYGLLGFAFPDSDNLTAQDVRGFCADCARILRVNFYTVRGRHFYAIPSWEKHQKLEKRTDRRKNPPPDHPEATPDLRFNPGADFAPESPRKSGADSGEKVAGTGEQGNRGTGEVELASQAPPTPKRGSRLSRDWMPSPEVIKAMRVECPNVDLEAEHRKFVDYWTDRTGKDATKVSWDGTWRNWIRRESEKRPQLKVVGGHVLSSLDAKALGYQEMKE